MSRKKIEAVLMFYSLIFFLPQLLTAGETPKIYSRGNILAAGNHNSNMGSSDITLIVQIEADGEIVLDEGHNVKYVIPQNEMYDRIEPGKQRPAINVRWFDVDYNDIKWKDGISGVGYGDVDDNTKVPSGNVLSIYSRYNFDLPQAIDLRNITVRVDYDDACILWLNGVEIFRSPNLFGTSNFGVSPGWNATPANHEALVYTAGKPNTDRIYPAENVRTIAVEYKGPTPISSIFIKDFSPKFGSVTGGDIISILGGPFPPNLNLTIGGQGLSDVKISESVLSGKTPAGNFGEQDIIIVTLEDGAIDIGKFTYIQSAGILLTELKPNNGALSGGTNGILTGQDFTTDMTIKVGDGIATDLTIGPTIASFKIPRSDKSGSVDVVVTTPDGKQAVLYGGYTYNPLPIIEDIEPNEGAIRGYTSEVIITGANFMEDLIITIGEEEIWTLSFFSATELRFRIPADLSGAIKRTAGLNSVSVTNPDGQTVILTNAFTFNEAPYIEDITPKAGPLTGETVIVIKGTGFRKGAVVEIGNQEAESYVKSEIKITATTPPTSSPGPVDIRVINIDGQRDTIKGEDDGFIYTRAPVITIVRPDNGKLDGGTRIQIMGSGFLPGSTVQIGTGTSFSAASAIEVLSDQLIVATTPQIEHIGPADLRVTNPDRQKILRKNGFTYLCYNIAF